MPSTPQRILILGATGGIGSRLARDLSGPRTQLTLVARDPDRTHALASELGATAFPGDATREATIQAAFDHVREQQGGIDAVVHLVGSVFLRPAHATTDEQFAATLDANLWSAFRVLRAAGRAMRDGGSLCFVSSVAAKTGLPNHESIAAAKAGVEGLVRSAAASYAPRGLRVNAVAPGLVETPMTASLTESETARAASEDLHPLQRLGRPEDVSRAIRFLIAPEASWVTGQILAIDGGMGSLRHRRRAR